jgi:hypothetical protein
MKTFRIKIRSILMLFATLITGCVFAQGYMPLPESNATWIVESGNSEVQDRKKIFIPDVERDTLINGLTYVKLFSRGAVFHGPWTPPPAPSYYYGPGYYGAYRSDDSGRSYIKFPAGSWGLGDEEILLMDLTVQKGDTIRQLPTYSSYDYSYVYSDLLVDSIDYVVNDPYTRKRIMLTNLNPPWGMECNFHWVEGLGNVSSGLQNAVGCGLENVGLTCISINDSIFLDGGYIWEDPIPGNCYYPYITAVNQEEIKIPMLVYPIPAIDYVIFEQHTSDKNGFITIADISGRPIASFPMTGEKTVWQTEGVKPGVYLYRLQTAEGRGSGKLLIAP